MSGGPTDLSQLVNVKFCNNMQMRWKGEPRAMINQRRLLMGLQKNPKQLPVVDRVQRLVTTVRFISHLRRHRPKREDGWIDLGKR
jgi:hypothetical protein